MKDNKKTLKQILYFLLIVIIFIIIIFLFKNKDNFYESDIKKIIDKKEEHLKNNIEFNKLTEKVINMDQIISWTKEKAKYLNNLGKNINILELGTKRSNINIPTHKKDMFKEIPNLNYVMSDYQDGIDVDIVTDLHNIKNLENNFFDLIITCSTYEHLKYPQLCSHNLMKILKIGGRIFIQTHFHYMDINMIIIDFHEKH